MADTLPAISGKQLARLLRLDGWESTRRATHGLFFYKAFPDGKRTTVIPDKARSLPPGTLSKVLGPLQTGLGSDGLRALIEKHGLK